MKAILLHAPFILIILSFIFLWICKRIKLWLPLSFIAYALYYFNHEISWQILILFWILFFASLWLEKSESSLGFIPFFILLVIGYGLFLEAFTPVAWSSIAKALPTNLSFSMVPSTLLPLNAFFSLGLLIPMNSGIKDWLCTIFLSALFASGLIFLMINFVDQIEARPLELKQNIMEIFFMIIPAEAFFRGFVQRELTNNINARGSSIFAILISSILFASLTLLKTHSQNMTLIAFIISIILCTIYQITKKIEVPILCHIFLNLGLQKFT